MNRFGIIMHEYTSLALHLLYNKYGYTACLKTFLSLTEISSVLFFMAPDLEKSSVWWVYMDQAQCQQRSSICLPHLSDPFWNAVVFFYRSCIFHGSLLGGKLGIQPSLGILIRWCGGRESRGLYGNVHPITVWLAFAQTAWAPGSNENGKWASALLLFWVGFL